MYESFGTDLTDTDNYTGGDNYPDDGTDLLGDLDQNPLGDSAVTCMPAMPTMFDDTPAPDPVTMPVMPSMTVPDLDPQVQPLPEPAAPAPLPPNDETPPAPAESPAPDTEGTPVPEDGTYGTPTAWTGDWFYQEVDGYCGPSSVAQVVSEYTGLDISDPQQLVDRALELGLFANGDPSQGMTSANMEILMEDQGVPCHLEPGSMSGLEEKLSDGYGVIAMVDSGEIWYPGEETTEDNTADHAVVVVGIDTERGVVILSDPGHPDGNQSEVPISVFEDAWADSGHEMLVADAPDVDLADSTTVDPTLAALTPRPWAIITLTHS
ncbi:C39 family peptidase [Rhodococcus sp. ARC_M6]|uniref:C39 family peptidase n=1 Tax=Rhodococcus sp. ARC_M6 TaxID=2928852 RepID=UPI001FB4E92B|nr:C39 family peptidase [Rhodococcus sp. ARC_M6]MCJ0907102.1 C39 family peptidase [Rhodococcus sp. ARC_M6]